MQIWKLIFRFKKSVKKRDPFRYPVFIFGILLHACRLFRPLGMKKQINALSLSFKLVFIVLPLWNYSPTKRKLPTFFFTSFAAPMWRMKKKRTFFSICFDIYDKFSYTQESVRRFQQNYCLHSGRVWCLEHFAGCGLPEAHVFVYFTHEAKRKNKSQYSINK